MRARSSRSLTRRVLLAGAAAAVAAQGRAAGGLRIGVISDLNGSYGSTDYDPAVSGAVARLVALRPDLVICAGDMVAGQRRPLLSEAEIAAMWAAFHAHVTDPLRAAGLPLLVAPGNHDASAYPGFEAERRAFYRTWTDRSPDVSILDGERYPFRYAVSFGDVLLIGLDVTLPGPLPPEEMDWLAQTLREERPRHRAAIVFSHLPLWAVARGRERDIVADPALEALEREAGVDLHLSGHHHAFYPGFRAGLAHVAQACLGAGPRRLIGMDAPSVRAFTLLDVAPDGRIGVSAYAAPDFATPTDFALLPPRLVSAEATLTRLDLAPPTGGVTP
ncbi:metallophosphoesterase family protein [Rubrimonas cliftonensis]|uniref:3',5'-cyclic AMP phosphodiesterase CpdA n=1 Tax=Rubrimonas cliftonensis TaxID=89524 RepID=A0A1H4FPC5_9RHOB|nr:metallophosphoesterase [Rubrimonas cliftonensis]SEA99223.1 3',5'-cyclic AMP phosphodiesterase CpdA [Rubrimonas cliftonensis]